MQFRYGKSLVKTCVLTVVLLFSIAIATLSHTTIANAQTPNPVPLYPAQPSVPAGPGTTVPAAGGFVKITVNITKSADTKAGTFGPLALELFDSTNVSVSKYNATTDKGETTATDKASKPIVLQGQFDNTDPGTYKACVKGHSDLCSGTITRTGASEASGTITIPAGKSDALLTASAAGSGATSCAIDGIGWIVCPTMNFMAYIADSSYSTLTDHYLLNTNTSMLNPDGATFKAWSIMRNIANVAFVIAFLIIIISQTTGAGITNYGIKKLLPRIIIAAILVNVSFYICALAVDLSNIIGFSLKDLLSGLSPPAAGVTGGSGTDWAYIVGAVLTVVGTAAVAGAAVAGGAIATLIPVLLTAVLGILMILLILAARQAFIVLLIVLSPLAFVAYLLPNTEKWFQSWQKMFTAMLLLFPIVALVFAASNLAADILSQTFAFAAAAPAASGSTNWLGQIIASGVRVIPLFAVPILLKKSLDSVGNIGTTINGMRNKVGMGAGNKLMGSRLGKHWVGEREKKLALIQSGVGADYAGKNPFKKISSLRSKAYKKYNESSLSGNFGNRSAAAGVALASEMEDKDVAAQEVLMRSQIKTPGGLISETQTSLQEAIESGDTVKARAANKILLSSGGKGIAASRKAIAATESGGRANSPKSQNALNSLRSDIAGAGLKSKDRVLDAWSTGGGKIDGPGGVASSRATYGGMSDTEMAGQSAEVIALAAAAGGIDSTRAAAILGNVDIMANIDPDTKAALGRV